MARRARRPQPIPPSVPSVISVVHPCPVAKGYPSPMADTIFTKIIKGEIPSHKLYEDEHVFAFLDINPLADGHALVVPKEPAATIDDLSDDAAAAIGRVLPRLVRAIKHATRIDEINILQNNGKGAGQEVPHVHFHIIPKPADDKGLIKQWNPTPIDQDEAAALASDIAAALGS